MDYLFAQWGRWAVLRRDSGIGWPGVAAGFQLVKIAGGRGPVDLWKPSDAELSAVDDAIMALDLELKQAVVAYYQFADTFRGAAAIISRAHGVAVDHKTVQRRVVRAQSIVGDVLGVRLATVGGAR